MNCGNEALENVRNLLHTAMEISKKMNKNTQCLETMMMIVRGSVMEEKTCKSLEEFMEYTNRRGHYTFAMRYPEENFGKFLLQNEEMIRIERRLEALCYETELLQRKLISMETILENKM